MVRKTAPTTVKANQMASGATSLIRRCMRPACVSGTRHYWVTTAKIEDLFPAIRRRRTTGDGHASGHLIKRVPAETAVHASPESARARLCEPRAHQRWPPYAGEVFDYTVGGPGRDRGRLRRS